MVHGNTRSLCLVGDELAQLVEGPTMQRCSLTATNFYPLTDTLEVFQGNGATGALRSFNDAFRDNMVNVAGKTTFLAPPLLEQPAGRLGTLTLQSLAQLAMPVAQAVDLPAGVGVAIRVSSDIDYAQVATEHALHVTRRQLFDIAGGEQIECSINVGEITLALSVGKQLPLVLAADERDGLATGNRPDRDGASSKVPAQNAVVIGDAAHRAERALCGPVEFVGIGHFGEATHHDLSGQAKMFLDIIIARMVELPLSVGVVIPRPCADIVAGRIGPFQRLMQGLGLLFSWQKFHLRRQFHGKQYTTIQDLMHV